MGSGIQLPCHLFAGKPLYAYLYQHRFHVYAGHGNDRLWVGKCLAG